MVINTLRFDEFLRRRSYAEMGREPVMGYLYRVVGFFVAIALILGGLVSIVIAPVFQASFFQALMGAVFGLIILSTGIAVSEIWAFKATHRWYSPSSPPYSRYQLTLSLTGFSVATVIIIILAFMLPVLQP